MSTTTSVFSDTFSNPPPPVPLTAADLQQRLGGIPLERIWLDPPPGQATEQDVLNAHDRHGGRLCELIDGVLVEKTMGYRESYLAGLIIHALHSFVEQQDLGIVLAPDAPLRILPKQVRMPDVCFFSWDRFPNRNLPKEQILGMAPDLAIEVLSPGNTPREMQRKLEDYFAAKVPLVWYIDPATRTAKSYTAVDQVASFGEHDRLGGGDVLPGYELDLAELFARLLED